MIKETGHDCVVVAPSLIPKKPGERVKTDRRDAVKLASLFRSGELTSVWVPDEEQEAIRDLTRAREEMKRVELQLKQRLGAFLLRHGKRYTAGKSKWTQRYYRWLADVKMDFPVQQIVLEEYLDAVKQAEERVRGLKKELERALSNWSLKPVVESLMALRGVQLVTAMSLVTELGDISRFDSPRQLMAYVGLVPQSIRAAAKRTVAGSRKRATLVCVVYWSKRHGATGFRLGAATTCRRKLRRQRNRLRRLHGRRRSGYAIATGFCFATERYKERSRRRSQES